MIGSQSIETDFIARSDRPTERVYSYGSPPQGLYQPLLALVGSDGDDLPAPCGTHAAAQVTEAVLQGEQEGRGDYRGFGG